MAKNTSILYKGLAQLRAIRRQLSLQTFRQRVVEHPFLDSTLKVVIADPVAQAWYEHKLPTAIQMHFLRDYGLKPGATVFNIGAHQAVIAAMLARIVTPTGKVVALDPDPFNFQVAQRNKTLNHLEQLEILCAAGADNTRMVNFGLAVGTSGHIAEKNSGLQIISAQAYCVDDLTQKYGAPDVLYIDVEGFEEHVLKGAAQTLASARPDCVVEVHIGGILEKAGGSVSGVLEYFPQEIYDIYIKHPHPNRRYKLVLLSEVGVENWTYHCNMVAVKKT